MKIKAILDELSKGRRMPVLSSVLKVIELDSEVVEPVSFSERVCSGPDDDHTRPFSYERQFVLLASFLDSYPRR